MIGLLTMLAVVGADTDAARCPMPVQRDQTPRAMIDNENTAKQIAEIYLTKIYGAELKGELPLQASLQDGIWYLRGHSRQLMVGGVAEIDLCQSNGQVLRVFHGE